MKTSIGLNSSDNDGSHCVVREQDRFMPIANVIRIMRKVLPTHAKISDDAKETIQECVSEYISFITSEANERCQREQRKTITAEDVLWAMNKLGFDDYVDPLSVFLRRYRELEGDHRGSVRGDPLQLRRPAFIAAVEADDESAGANSYGLHQNVPVSGMHQYQVYGSGLYGDPGAGSSVQPNTDFDLYSAYK